MHFLPYITPQLSTNPSSFPCSSGFATAVAGFSWLDACCPLWRPDIALDGLNPASEHFTRDFPPRSDQHFQEAGP
jgi:hypothetical protein